MLKKISDAVIYIGVIPMILGWAVIGGSSLVCGALESNNNSQNKG